MLYPTLEFEFQGELNHSRVVHRAIDQPKRRGRIDVLHSARTSRQEELSMVEQVEELGTELQARAFARQHEILDDRKIRVHKPRSGNRCTSSIPKFAWLCLHKGARIEPVLYGMDLRRRSATRVPRDRPALVRIPHLIRTIQDIAVPHEVDT